MGSGCGYAHGTPVHGVVGRLYGRAQLIGGERKARRRQLPRERGVRPGCGLHDADADAYTAPRCGSRDDRRNDLRGERRADGRNDVLSGQRGLLLLGVEHRPLPPGSIARARPDPDGEEAEAEGQGKLTATANVDGTLALAAGIKPRWSSSRAAHRRRSWQAEEEVRKQLDEKLDDGKKARLKVNGTLTDTSDATDGAG